MTEEEIRRLLVELEDLLRDLNLDFIIAQERVLAAEGVSKAGAELGDRAEAEQPYVGERTQPPLEVRLRQNELPFETTQQPPKRVRFTNDDVRVTPLDVRERLANLLDLVEVATAGTLAMERFVHDEVTALRDQPPLEPAQEREGAVNRPVTSNWTASWDGTVVFADPPEAQLRGVRQEPWTLAVGSAFEASTAHAINVVSLIELLREQSGVVRGQWLARSAADGAEYMWSPTKGTS